MNDTFFEYRLPEHLIAQEPAAERDGSRLLVLDRKSGEIEHRWFRDFPEVLSSGDLVVLNNTRVLPARLIGYRKKTGGKWAGLFLRESSEGLWELLAQTRGHPEIGETIVLDPGPLRLTLRGRSNGHWLVEPSLPGSAFDLLSQSGHVPLPPYIRKGNESATDRERYQTVFAERNGSIAAPTAGLHFTPGLLERLRSREIRIAHVTLHVGLGTFEPIKTSDPTQHLMHAEWGEVPAGTVSAIHECRARGNRVFAIGTTATRALEAAVSCGKLEPWQGETRIFIHPPHRFCAIDGLVTNFHLPRTTLLMLVSAFAGSNLVQRAYDEAIQHEYRFFSYGDAMLIR